MADCKNCPSEGECDSKEDCMIKNNPYNSIKRVIGVMSGKGGVGKSTISALVAKDLKEKGYKVGIMDADITGPSIPRLLGIKDRSVGQNELGLLPVQSKSGISVMSLNLLIDDEQKPVIWRGPIISNVIKQFWEEVFWGDLDYLIIDMPPGTGDVALTVMQSIPINGILIVSVPQDMVSMIVAKAINMVKELKIKLIGIVQNMSYIKCPDCSKKIKIFKSDSTDELYHKLGINFLGELPMTVDIANISDEGIQIEDKDILNIVSNITNSIIESVKTKKK